MADKLFNVAIGRWAEFFVRVDNNDPAASTIVVMVLAAAGLESDSVLQDKVTFADVLAGTTNQVTNANYARKVLTDADTSAFAPDHTNNWASVTLPNQTFTSIGAGDAWAKVVWGYDPSSSGVTDSVIIPMFMYDYTATPVGANIIVGVNASGLARGFQP